MLHCTDIQHEHSEIMRLLLQYTEMQKAYESDSGTDLLSICCSSDVKSDRFQKNKSSEHPKASIHKRNHLSFDEPKIVKYCKTSYANVIGSTRKCFQRMKGCTHAKDQKGSEDIRNIAIEIPSEESLLFNDPFHDDWHHWE